MESTILTASAHDFILCALQLESEKRGLVGQLARELLKDLASCIASILFLLTSIAAR